MGRLVHAMNRYEGITAATPLWVGKAVSPAVEISLSEKAPGQ
jgi:hypothetical protein